MTEAGTHSLSLCLSLNFSSPCTCRHAPDLSLFSPSPDAACSSREEALRVLTSRFCPVSLKPRRRATCYQVSTLIIFSPSRELHLLAAARSSAWDGGGLGLSRSRTCMSRLPFTGCKPRSGRRGTTGAEEEREAGRVRASRHVRWGRERCLGI